MNDDVKQAVREASCVAAAIEMVAAARAQIRGEIGAERQARLLTKTLRSLRTLHAKKEKEIDAAIREMLPECPCSKIEDAATGVYLRDYAPDGLPKARRVEYCRGCLVFKTNVEAAHRQVERRGGRITRTTEDGETVYYWTPDRSPPPPLDPIPSDLADLDGRNDD